MPTVDILSSLQSSSNMNSVDFTNCAPGLSFSDEVRKRLLFPESSIILI